MEKELTLKERVQKWAEDLTPKQMETALVECVVDLIHADNLRMWSDSPAPYWEATGDPLVEGQKCFPDEDEDE